MDVLAQQAHSSTVASPSLSTQATDVARAIVKALTQAHLVGRAPAAIVLDAATQEGLQTLGLGYWSAGPGTWSLFNVPVLIENVPGWHLLFAPQAEAA